MHLSKQKKCYSFPNQPKKKHNALRPPSFRGHAAAGHVEALHVGRCYLRTEELQCLVDGRSGSPQPQGGTESKNMISTKSSESQETCDPCNK